MKRATLRETLRLVTMLALATTGMVAQVACDPGDYDAPDAAPPPPPPDAAPLPDAAKTCDEPSTQSIDGHHLPGQPCMGCHETGSQGAPIFTLAGTLFASRDGGQGVVGATLHIKDANGEEDTVITGTYGNFYSKKNYAYPLKVTASSCPDTAPMITDVTRPGNCNSSGCHALGDPSGRAHLP